MKKENHLKITMLEEENGGLKRTLGS